MSDSAFTNGNFLDTNKKNGSFQNSIAVNSVDTEEQTKSERNIKQAAYTNLRRHPQKSISYWRLAYALLQFDIMVPSTTLEC
jgi:hypothetical protein